MSSAPSLFAESITGKSLLSMLPAKPQTSAASPSSAQADSSDNSAPSFGDTLQAAMKPRDDQPDRTSTAPKNDAADEKDTAAVEEHDADQRELRRTKDKGHKPVKNGKKAPPPADADSQPVDDSATEATDPQSSPDASQTNAKVKTPPQEPSAKPVNKPDVLPAQSAAVPDPNLAAAIVAAPTPPAASANQPVPTPEPAAAGNAPAPPPPIAAKLNSPTDAADRASGAEKARAAAAPAAAAAGAPATSKPAPHEISAKTPPLPKDAGEKTNPPPPLTKITATKANADPFAQQDAPPELNTAPDPSAPHPTPAIKPLVNPVQSASQPDPQSPAPSGAPSAPSPAAGADAAQNALASIVAHAATNTAPATNSPDAPKPAANNSAVTSIGSSATTAPAPTDDRADAAAPAQQSPAPDADQTFEQVVMGLRGKVDARNGTAEIRLDPPNLGSLHVSIHLQNGSLTAQFQSSSDVVRDLLKDNMQKLKTVLEGQGIAVDKLAVNAPADKVVMPAAKMPGQNGANNDGRSAGQYTRDPNSGQKRSSAGNAFAAKWRDATAAQDAPMDVIG